MTSEPRTTSARSPLTVAKGAPGSRILALGAYRPARVVDNEEICRHIDSSDEWIRERSGIVERRFASAQETPVVMATGAARQALAEAGVAATDVDVVIVATISHMLQTPAAAPMVADALGATPAAAFDVSAACAGFCYGLGLADDMIRSGSAAHVLVIGVEKMTDLIALDDRGSSFLFADGAGAALVGPSDTPRVSATLWGSDGSGADFIMQDEPWTVLRDEHEDDTPWPTTKMAGQSVFRWAVTKVVGYTRDALKHSGVAAEDLAAFIPHQANNRITDAMVKQLKLPEHVVVARDVVTSGNTSGASVPLAMHALLRENPELAGKYALLIGFGAGLAYAAQVVELPPAPVGEPVSSPTGG